MKLKFPKFSKLPQLPKFQFPKPKQQQQQRRLQATARRAAAPVADDYDDEDEDVPTTRFSTAFVVVLFLHLVAVGGIYAFKSIKAHRATQDAAIAAASGPKASNQKPAVSQDTESVSAAPAAQQAAVVPVSAPAPQNVSVTPVSGAKVYHVKAGDSLSRVAANHSVTTADLAEANGLKESAALRQGQVLNIPTARPAAKTAPAADAHKAEFLAKKEEGAAKSAATTAAAAKTYVVKKGDNPVVIARNLNVPYDELLKLNKIEDPKKLQIGAVLKVPPAKKAN